MKPRYELICFLLIMGFDFIIIFGEYRRPVTAGVVVSYCKVVPAHVFLDI